MVKKVTYTTILLCLMVAGLAVPAAAQQQKIGYVNTDYILSKMSEYEGVKQQLSSISSEWKSKLKQIEKEIKNLEKDFKAKKILYSDELKSKKQQEIQNKIKKRKQFLDDKFGADGAYFSKQQELLEPIQRKIFKAVNAVAKRNDFDYVFDRAQNSNMLYSSQQWNLNDEVLQELDITLKKSSN